MVTVALFIVIMDILKYGFGIDAAPIKKDKIKKQKPVKKVKNTNPPIRIRFIYVNPSPPSLQSQNPTITITETVV
jgi:hypothetical protein